MCHKRSVPEEGIGGDRGGHILCIFLRRNMDGFQWDLVFLCGFLHSRYPVEGKGTLVCVIEDKAGFVQLGMLGAVLEFWQIGARYQWQVQQCNAAIRSV